MQGDLAGGVTKAPLVPKRSSLAPVAAPRQRANPYHPSGYGGTLLQFRF